MTNTDPLIAERDRIESDLAELNEKQVNLEKKRAEITRKAEATARDAETPAQLKIETEQLAEAKRMNDRLIAQTAKRLTEIEETIATLKYSDIA